jgi:hypothetical protein
MNTSVNGPYCDSSLATLARISAFASFVRHSRSPFRLRRKSIFLTILFLLLTMRSPPKDTCWSMLANCRLLSSHGCVGFFVRSARRKNWANVNDLVFAPNTLAHYSLKQVCPKPIRQVPGKRVRVVITSPRCYIATAN